MPYVYRRYSMLIEPAIYLNALLRDFLIARGELVVREFRDTPDLASLREPLLFNCTGLGCLLYTSMCGVQEGRSDCRF